MRIKNLPAGTQEGLLQQMLEKHCTLKRVEVFVDLNEATVEFENAAVRCLPTNLSTFSNTHLRMLANSCFKSLLRWYSTGIPSTLQRKGVKPLQQALLRHKLQGYSYPEPPNHDHARELATPENLQPGLRLSPLLAQAPVQMLERAKDKTISENY